MYLYEFRFDCGRSGSLTGMFAVDDRGKKALNALIKSGTEVNFGEVLGKHSDVYGPIGASDVKTVKATPEEIVTVIRVLRAKPIDPNGRPWTTITGHNPLEQFGEQTELSYANPWDDARFLRACKGEDYEVSP